MHSTLETILAAKKKEVAVLLEKVSRAPQSPIAKLLQGEIVHTPKKEIKKILSYEEGIKVIAEIKRKSPAKGDFAPIADPCLLAQEYIAGGASAISILTDSFAFGGCLQDLEMLAEAPETKNIPLLRKDFLIDPIQIAESIVYGADMVLLIVAALGNNLGAMLQKTCALHMTAIVEIYCRDEIQIATDAGAEIILVNNRNLHTFDTNTDTAFQLAPYLPKNAIKIAASGIATPALAKDYFQAGYAAVLVGETLVTAQNPSAWIRACRER